MSEQSFIEALDQALELLNQGYPREHCIQQFPEHADRLWPMLQVADDLQCLAYSFNASLDRMRVDPDWQTLLADLEQDQPEHFPTSG